MKFKNDALQCKIRPLKRWGIRIGITLTILMAILLVSAPVFADMAAPDSTPEVESVNVYRNLLETGDNLYIIYASIPYASTPDTPVNEAFIWRLLDTDGETELGCTTGYAYNENGYGDNVFSLYFAASEGLVWGTQYPLRLSGNPAVFSSPPEYNYLVSSSDYSAITDTDAAKLALAELIIYLAEDLDNRWDLGTAYSLLVQGEAGTTLSIYGESFFRGAIYGCQALAPSAFSFVLTEISATERSWNLEYTGNVTSQWSGTWVETARNAGANLFSTSYDLTSIIILLVLGVGVLVGNTLITHNAWSGIIDASVVMILGARLGLYAMGFLGLVMAVCIIYMATRIWGFTR